ncbi:methanol--corrinoid methyltransferase [bacterium AH-315-I18]|nr:methanol--corrinoid methyltransferase [bacterium AH-315-I18]
MSTHYTSLAIDDPTKLVFGHAPNPLTLRRGMVLGGGLVYPEINFTLPPMLIEAGTMNKVCTEYRQMITGVLKRAAELESPGVLVEFETLPPMTEHPDWGMQIVNILLDAMEEAHAKDGLASALRMTPNDNREMVRPPQMRSGIYWEGMLELFDRSAAAGAELLSIESVGGKELHDDALTMGDMQGSIFGLSVLGARDMKFLWTHIVEIAKRHGVHAAGDTACGFGNTAMVLAEQKMIPRVFAAVVRAVTAVRSLVAYECGAVGPGKDCGYENPILKAITGFPMSMEGKCASCAHFSPMGNLAAACCDTWSNESIQNVKLLGGMAPTMSMEQLIYDCRLMNVALGEGPKEVLKLRDWFVASDDSLDPQAYILRPDCCVQLAQAIISKDTPYTAARHVGLTAIDILRQAHADKSLKLSDRELPWLDTMTDTIQEMPDDENVLAQQVIATTEPGRFLPAEYGLTS